MSFLITERKRSSMTNFERGSNELMMIPLDLSVVYPE